MIMHINEVGEVGGKYTKFTSTQNIILKKQTKKLVKHVRIKGSLSSPYIWASFHPQTPLSISNQWYLQSNEIAFKSGCEMLKFGNLMHMV